MFSIHEHHVCYGGFVFFQAEDGIRDLVRSRGLGDVYKRQGGHFPITVHPTGIAGEQNQAGGAVVPGQGAGLRLSLIHI